MMLVIVGLSVIGGALLALGIREHLEGKRWAREYRRTLRVLRIIRGGKK